MRFKATLMICAVLFGGAAKAQVAPGTPAPHQPGVAASKPAPAQAPAAPSQAPEKIDPAKEAKIRQLMEVTQSVKLGDNISAYINNQVRTVMSHSLAPEKVQPFMDAFAQKFNPSAQSTAVTAAVIPIYARLLSTEDLDGLLQFYQSPLGQRTLKALPEITQQSENAGVQIEQKAAMDTLQAMSGDYPELKNLLAPQGGASSGPGGPGGPPASGLSPAVPNR
jgi:uncharacterized protein